MKGSKGKTSHRWMTKIGLLVLALLLAVSCSIQPEHQITRDRLEHLQGQILVWVEIISRSKEAQTPTSHGETALTDIIKNFQV